MVITDKMLDEMIGAAKIQEGVFGKGGLLNTLSKRLLERMFDSEIPHHLGKELQSVLKKTAEENMCRDEVIKGFAENRKLAEEDR